eukprot:544436_1
MATIYQPRIYCKDGHEINESTIDNNTREYECNHCDNNDRTKQKYYSCNHIGVDAVLCGNCFEKEIMRIIKFENCSLSNASRASKIDQWSMDNDQKEIIVSITNTNINYFDLVEDRSDNKLELVDDYSICSETDNYNIAQFGLQQGDILTKINDKEINNIGLDKNDIKSIWKYHSLPFKATFIRNVEAEMGKKQNIIEEKVYENEENEKKSEPYENEENEKKKREEQLLLCGVAEEAKEIDSEKEEEEEKQAKKSDIHKINENEREEEEKVYDMEIKTEYEKENDTISDIPIFLLDFEDFNYFIS